PRKATGRSKAGWCNAGFTVMKSPTMHGSGASVGSGDNATVRASGKGVPKSSDRSIRSGSAAGPSARIWHHLAGRLGAAVAVSCDPSDVQIARFGMVGRVEAAGRLGLLRPAQQRVDHHGAAEGGVDCLLHAARGKRIERQGGLADLDAARTDAVRVEIGRGV